MSDIETAPEQAARLTSVILEARCSLTSINRQMDGLATMKARYITTLNSATKALSNLVGGL